MNFKKVLILAVISLLTATTVNAETVADPVDNLAPVGTINGDDYNVTFIKLDGRRWQAVMDSTHTKRPFNIIVDDSEWLRELYVYEGYVTRNDSLLLQLAKGNEKFEFPTRLEEWKTVLAGQTVVLTEIKSVQPSKDKSFFSLTAIEDAQIPFYAAHKPSAKPVKNYRKNATVPAPAANDKKSKKAGKNGKKRQMTEDELIEALESGADLSGTFTEETTGDLKFSK